MAVRATRGPISDYDPAKMLEGQIAYPVSGDGTHSFRVGNGDGTDNELAFKSALDTLQTLVNKVLASGSPVLGSLAPWPLAAIPSNCLLADGSTASRTAYPDLFALYGTQFGAGDGSTTFGLPDWRGVVPVGYKSGDDTFGTLGAKVGNKTHNQTLANPIAYFNGAPYILSHDWNDTLQANVGAAVTKSAINVAAYPVGSGGTSTYETQTMTMSGSSVQPSVVVNWIIIAKMSNAADAIQLAVTQHDTDPAAHADIRDQISLKADPAMFSSESSSSAFLTGGNSTIGFKGGSLVGIAFAASDALSELTFLSLGKNVCNLGPAQSITFNGITVSKSLDGTITINGTVTSGANLLLQSFSGAYPTVNDAVIMPLIRNQKYAFSIAEVSGSQTPSGNGWILNCNHGTTQLAALTNGGTKNKVFFPNTDVTSFQFFANVGCVFDNYTFKIQLEPGDTATEPETYQEEYLQVNDTFAPNDVFEYKNDIVYKNGNPDEKVSDISQYTNIFVPTATPDVSYASTVSQINGGVQIEATTAGPYNYAYWNFNLIPNIKYRIKSNSATTGESGGGIIVYTQGNINSTIAESDSLSPDFIFTSPSDGKVSIAIFANHGTSKSSPFSVSTYTDIYLVSLSETGKYIGSLHAYNGGTILVSAIGTIPEITYSYYLDVANSISQLSGQVGSLLNPTVRQYLTPRYLPDENIDSNFFANCYFMGRWMLRTVNGAPAMVTINQGSEIYAKVRGTTQVTASFVDISSSGHTPYIAYSIDGGVFTRSSISASMQLASGLDANEHYVRIIASGIYNFDAVWEQAQGLVFTGLSVDSGGTITAVKPKNRIGMFIGDSITAGINIAGTDFAPVNNIAEQNFSFVCCQNLNCVNVRVGFGGTGVVKTGDGGVPNCLTFLDSMMDGIPEESQLPDFIVLNQGTNDGSTLSAEFQAAYQDVIIRLSIKYPGVLIFCVRPFNGTHAADIQEVSDNNVNCIYVDTSSLIISTSDGTHPDAAGSIIAGDFLARKIQSVFGDKYFYL